MNAALMRAHKRAPHDLGRVVVQAQVVEGELERLTRRLEEPGDQARDVERRLPAVRQRVNLDQGCCFARSDALYARFFAW
jgi:hypothetical protein